MHEVFRIVATHEGNRGDCRGIDNGHRRPAINKSDEVTIDLFQIDVWAARLRVHGPQFGIDRGAEKRDNPAYQPDAQQQQGATQLAGHGCRPHENTRADHAADHEGGRRPEADAFFQGRGHMTVLYLIRSDRR